MNIFYLSTDPRLAAKQHCDQHVVKMMVETAQLLCTAHHVCETATPNLYKPTHKNHPCAIWVRNSRANYQWAYRLLYWLCTEYEYRRGRKSKVEELLPSLAVPPGSLSSEPFVDPPQCMPEKYKSNNTVAAYQNYYIGDKTFARWVWKRKPPLWWQPELEKSK